MPVTRKKGKARTANNNAIPNLLYQEGTIALLSEAQPDDARIMHLVQQISLIKPNISTAKQLVNLGLGLTRENRGTPLYNSLKALSEKITSLNQAEKQRQNIASHNEKQSFISSLGLNAKPVSIQDILLDAGISSIKIVWRERSETSTINLKSVLADTQCHPGDAVVNAETGFYVVEPGESVIFVSRRPRKSFKVELVVYRGIAQSSEHSEALYEWASGVVTHACRDRRNPNHDGSMVQIGWNAGPQHARVWGLAKSFDRKIDQETMAERDEDAIVLLMLCWSLAKALMPAEVMDVLEASLEDSRMPRIATRNVPEGCGYRLHIGGKTYSFPDFERAPPEGYLSQDYVAWAHIDKCWAGGPQDRGYGLSYCVGRTVDGIQTGNHSRATRSGSGESRAAWPAGGGGNFVDITLRAVVRQATGTLIAFQPDYPHGTTRLCGAHNCTCAVTFSAHILEAYRIAAQGAKVESGPGAGEGIGTE